MYVEIESKFVVIRLVLLVMFGFRDDIFSEESIFF